MDDERAQQGRRVWLLELACLVGALVAIAVLVVLGDWPHASAFFLFLACMIWAANAGVDLPSTTQVSPASMVLMAAITAYHGHGLLLGAALTAFTAGIDFRQLRLGRIRIVAYNCASCSLAAIGAAATYGAIESRGVSPLVAMLPAIAAYAAANVALILPAIVLDTGAPAREVWGDMRPALPNYLAFGILGTLVGLLYEQLGALAVALLITPVAIARAAFASYLELHQAHEETIRVLLRAIEAKDPYTAGHTQRVAQFSLYIGEKLGFSQARLQNLRHAALVHDVGKLAVPSHLLTKPGKLTDDEFRQVQRHASVCIDILSAVDFLRPMTAAASGHHARYDGGGYGGTGSLPLEASIVAVADAFDAMTSTRAYRRALTQEVALGELQSKAGTQLHPACVQALIDALEERGEVHGAGYEIDLVSYEVPPPVAGPGSAGLGDLVDESSRT